MDLFKKKKTGHPNSIRILIKFGFRHSLFNICAAMGMSEIPVLLVLQKLKKLIIHLFLTNIPSFEDRTSSCK